MKQVYSMDKQFAGQPQQTGLTGTRKKKDEMKRENRIFFFPTNSYSSWFELVK